MSDKDWNDIQDKLLPGLPEEKEYMFDCIKITRADMKNALKYARLRVFNACVEGRMDEKEYTELNKLIDKGIGTMITAQEAKQKTDKFHEIIANKEKEEMDKFLEDILEPRLKNAIEGGNYSYELPWEETRDSGFCERLIQTLSTLGYNCTQSGNDEGPLYISWEGKVTPR